MQIIKSNGDKVPFSADKVRASIRRTGADEAIIETVLENIEKQVHEGMTTAKLHHVVLNELKKESTCFACRYNLREAILKLGPAGFKFEKYVSSILNAYNYDARVPEDEFEGSCTRHEIDVIAKKSGRTIFIEAKFRNNYKDSVNLKDTMATWARFLDLVDGAAIGKCPHFDEVWIVTNARFSDRAKQFGVCKGMHMIGWGFPAERSFAGMVDFNSLYPITVLDGLKQSELDAFSDQGILLCREVANKDAQEIAGKIGIETARAQKVIEMCVDVVSGDESVIEHKHKNE
jgi:hypothetical protein